MDIIRAAQPNGGIVCLMSGNFVQRGMPAIFDKIVRAKAAVCAGADLVLELPVAAALSSAEGFAAGGVEILSKFCDTLCFGAENANTELLMTLANALLSDAFSNALRTQLEQGFSFPAARQAALEGMGLDASALALPNNILAAEYCKAILSQHSPMTPWVIRREGNYHATEADRENPSATALRQLIKNGKSWQDYVPNASCYDGAAVHALCYGERAMLYRLRTMTDAEFEALPYGSEGLWRKLMHAARKEAALEDIIAATKSKRYTRSRIDRMIMCAFLGITEETLSSPAPYVRVLALNDIGREILKKARQSGNFVNIGEKQDDPYQALEDRCGQLYGLFAQQPEAPDSEAQYRIYYQQ